MSREVFLTGIVHWKLLQAIVMPEDGLCGKKQAATCLPVARRSDETDTVGTPFKVGHLDRDCKPQSAVPEVMATMLLLDC